MSVKKGFIWLDIHKSFPSTPLYLDVAYIGLQYRRKLCTLLSIVTYYIYRQDLEFDP